MLSSARIDAYLTERVTDNSICGAVVLIAHDGVVLHEKAYGYAQKYKLDAALAASNSTYLEVMSQCKSILVPPVPLSTDYLFDLASLTKVLATTMAIMLLVDQQKLNLDDPVKNYLQEFDKPDKASITIRHLLSHSSGLTPWKPLYYHVSNADDVVKLISEMPLAYEVDSQRLYSDLGLIILRFVIEHVAKQKFDEFIHENLYDKLELKNTLFNPKGKREKIAATSHGNPFEYKMIADENFGFKCSEVIDDFTGWRNYTLNGEANDGNAYHVFAGISGHAGLFSTAEDVNVLMQLLLNEGRFHDSQIIRRETIQQFLTKSKHHHGLGWAMSSGNASADLPLGNIGSDPIFNGAFGHTGFTRTFVLAIPEEKISVVLLTNTQNLGVNDNGAYNDVHEIFQTILNFVVNDFGKIDEISAGVDQVIVVNPAIFSRGI